MGVGAAKHGGIGRKNSAQNLKLIINDGDSAFQFGTNIAWYFWDRCNKQDEKYGDVISEGSGKYGGFVLRNYKAQCICTFMFFTRWRGGINFEENGKRVH